MAGRPRRSQEPTGAGPGALRVNTPNRWHVPLAARSGLSGAVPLPLGGSWLRRTYGRAARVTQRIRRRGAPPGCSVTGRSRGRALGYAPLDASGTGTGGSGSARAAGPGPARCRRSRPTELRRARRVPGPRGAATRSCSTPRSARRTVCRTRTPSRWNMPEALVGVTVRQPCCLARGSRSVTACGCRGARRCVRRFGWCERCRCFRCSWRSGPTPRRWGGPGSGRVRGSSGPG